MPTEAEYEAISEEAEEMGLLGRDADELRLLRQGLDKAKANGDEAFSLFFEAELAAVVGDLERALELGMAADMLKSNTPLILSNAGLALCTLGRHEEAVRYLKRAVAIRPLYSRAFSNYAVALKGTGKGTEALEMAEKAVAIRPSCLSALVIRATILADLGRYDEALESCDQALAVGPDAVLVLRVRGVVLGRAGRQEEAIACFQRCLAADPEDTQSRMWLARFAGEEEAKSLVEEEGAHRRREAQEAAERKLKLEAWRSLSARVAHRIGNQHFAARGALRSLSQLELGEAVEALEDLDGCLDRIRRIMQEFENFSVNQPPKPTPTDVGRLLNDVARRYRRQAGSVEVRVDVTDHLPTCSLDRAQMDQALGELAENAIRHTPSGGAIRLSADAADRGGRPVLRLAVSDTGSGIENPDKVRVFDAFFSNRPGGTGLGLAIVKQIVENHGGSIRETGRPGEGARFEIDLPVEADVEHET